MSGDEEGGGWTLGAVKARGMEINAICANADCRHLFVFDTDRLVEGVGADYAVANIPALDCTHCGGTLDIKLSFATPQDEERN